MASVSLRFCITDKGIMNAMVFFRYKNTLPYQIWKKQYYIEKYIKFG